jgi:hypothetical protein
MATSFGGHPDHALCSGGFREGLAARIALVANRSIKMSAA